MKSFKFQIIILGLLLFSTFVHSQNLKQFYISPSGNDKYAGTIAKPFATLEKARKEVRNILAKEKNISISVYFRGGDYFLKNSVVFDSLDSGSENYPVTYSSYNNEEVSFSGGISIPVKHATPVKDDLVLNRFAATAKNKILQVDLKKLGIKDLGTLTPRG